MRDRQRICPPITVGGAVSSGALAHLHIEHLWQLGSHAGVIAVISSVLYFVGPGLTSA